jgi:hypothetical protein
MGYDVMFIGSNSLTFQRSLLPQYSGMEAASSSKTLIITNQHAFIAQKILILMPVFIHTVSNNNYNHSCA